MNRKRIWRHSTSAARAWCSLRQCRAMRDAAEHWGRGGLAIGDRREHLNWEHQRRDRLLEFSNNSTLLHFYALSLKQILFQIPTIITEPFLNFRSPTRIHQRASTRC